MTKEKSRPGAPRGRAFRLGKINSVVVTRYARISDSRDNPGRKRVAVINDPETIARLVALVNRLPARGTAMIKMGDVEWISAEFYGHYDTPPVTVNLYEGMVQAPDTSFYEGLPEESEIHGILSRAKPRPKDGLRLKAASSVRVEEYDHACYEGARRGPNRAVEITDARTVGALLGLLNRFPLKGEVFVSHTPLVPLTQVFFVGEDGEETLVDLYAGSVATTDGSFYCDDPGTQLQREFRTILRTALNRVAPERRYAFDADKAESVSVELRSRLTDDRPAAWNEITEPKVIRKIRAALAALPPRGDTMKSWSDDTELLSATFSRPGAPRTYVEFYDGRIKTPDTAFYSASKRPEGSLYRLLKKQLKGK